MISHRKKITVLSAMINNYGCDWVRHVFNCLSTFILKAIKPRSQVIYANVGYGYRIATLLKRKGVQLREGAEIHPNAYLFKHATKGIDKRRGKKKAVAVAAEQSLSSNTPLTLIKRKRIQKQVEVLATNLEESLVDREPMS